MESFVLEVPIQIIDSAIISDKVYDFSLRFRGPKGGEFGEPIPMKIKVVAPKASPEKIKNQVELVKLAVKLFDVLKLGKSYDECLEVVTSCNGDEIASI